MPPEPPRDPPGDPPLPPVLPSPAQAPVRPPTSAERERTIALVSEGFAAGIFDVDELDRRLTVAHSTEDRSELARLEADLDGLASARAAEEGGLPALARPALVPAREVRSAMHVWAIMGGAQRRGTWSVPRTLHVTTVMGGCELDFREARFPEGPVDVHIRTFMGGVQILVPPNLAVEMNGSAIMGGFDHVARSRAAPDPGAPLLRIHGLAVMGGVDVRTRLPDESGWQARLRTYAEKHVPAALDHLRRAADPWSARAERHARRAARQAAKRLERDARRLPPPRH